jgi:WD40 repeat protein
LNARSLTRWHWWCAAGLVVLVSVLVFLEVGWLSRVPELPPARAVLPGSGFAHGLGFSADGSTLVAANDDGRLQVWDVAARRLRASAAHPFRFPLMAVAPDGRWAAVGGWIVEPGESDVTRILDVPTGRRLALLPGTASPCDFAVSADGQALTVVVSRGDTKDLAVQTWDTATWRPIAEVVVPAEPFGVAFSARLFNDGHLLALVSRKDPGIVTLWDVNTGRQTGTLNPEPDASGADIFGLALSPNGRTLAAAHSHARVVLWDVNTGRIRTTLSGPTREMVYFRLAFTRAGHSLVGAGHTWAGGLPVSRLYPVARSLGLPTESRPILEWVIWDVTRGQVRSALTVPSSVRAPPGTGESIGLSGNFALSSDGGTMATSHPDGTILLRDQSTSYDAVVSTKDPRAASQLKEYINSAPPQP